MRKLTLSADKDVIEQAKRIATERGTSVSTMFSQFVKTLDAQGRKRRRTAPITRRLRGLSKVSPEKSDRALFEEAIQEKARR